MSTQLKSSPALKVVTSGSPVPVGSALFTNLTVSNVSVTNGVAQVTFTAAHGITNAGTGKVTFWGVGTNTWLNQLTVSTTAVPSTTVIQFFTNEASGNITNGSDTGSAVVSPVERYRALRIEVDQSAGSAIVYVGDQFLNIGSSPKRYSAALSLTGQIAFEISGEGIDPCLTWVDASANSTYAQVSLIN